MNKKQKTAKVNVSQLESIITIMEKADNLMCSRVACMDEDTQGYYRDAKEKIEEAIQLMNMASHVESTLIEEE